MNSQELDYLSRLPENARYEGDHTRGEIELVGEAGKVAKIVEELRNRFAALGLPRDAAKIGIVAEDEYILVTRDPVEFPSGKTGTYLRIFERSGLDGPAGVVMLPMRNGVVYLRKVFRHATRRWELECPRGFRPQGMSLQEAVRQEMAEEIGLSIRDIRDLGCISANTGLLAGSARAFLVLVEEGRPEPRPEETEAFGEFVILDPRGLFEKIRAGEIRDGFTLSALQLAQAHNLLPVEYAERA